MYIFLVKVLLFIVILKGEVRSIVFRLIKSPDEFRCRFQITPELVKLLTIVHLFTEDF